MAKGKYIECKTTVADALSDAMSIVTDLQSEMSDWRDSLEDKFSSTEKYERVSEAADSLENCEMESRVERLTELLEELGEGKDAEPGCPEHVVGEKCPLVKKCKWDGVAKKPYGEKQKILRFDPPKTHTGEWHVGSVKKTLTDTYFGSIGNQSWCVREPSTDALRAEARADFEREAAAVEEANARLDRLEILPRIATIAEVLPIEGLEDLVTRDCVYSEFRAYKHTSRADRLSNAVGAATAAIDVVRAALEEYEAKKKPKKPRGEVGDPEDDRIDDVETAISEVEEAIGELEGVEFPGMYG
jgi:hypothetical protein